MASRKVKADMEVLQLHLDKFKRRSFFDVSQLPAYSEIPEASTDEKYKIAVYCDKLENGNIRVVLQSYRYYFFGMGAIYAKGWIYDSSNHVQPVPEDELWSFM